MIAGGFLDIALFTTNCEQLKFAIESEYLITDTRFKFVIVMLAVSLTLQVSLFYSLSVRILSYCTNSKNKINNWLQQQFENNNKVIISEKKLSA